MKKVAVLGATGYTGVELVRLLLYHRGVEMVFLSSESYQGMELSRAHPQFEGALQLSCSPLDPAKVPLDTDIVFCALPHGRSAEVVPDLLARGLRVIDLSADFRLKDASLYPRWYERAHPQPQLLAGAVYGLPELIGHAEIRKAVLLANPGCYPTCALLSLLPLAREGLLETRGIVVDAKSGVTGAGRAPRQAFHYPEVHDSFKAYRVGSHQHTPEIEQELSGITGGEMQLTFTPHLVPMNRGILSTSYLYLSEDRSQGELDELYRCYYEGSPFVRVLGQELLPETRWVRGTNYCDLAVRKDDRTGRVIVIGAIDNLVKGASGQAVQNMNIMLGWPEETDLLHTAMVP